MANLDGFILTHTYEVVDVPAQEQADEFLPPYVTDNKVDFDEPKNIAFTAGPDYNMEFKYREHVGMLNAKTVIKEAEEKFAKVFGRKYTGLLEEYKTQDADYILITLGSIAGVAKEIADKLRAEGKKAGVLRIRYIRPMPNAEIAEVIRHAKGFAVLEKDISFGNEGSVYTNVSSALAKAGISVPGANYIGGLGGRDIPAKEIEQIFADMERGVTGVQFIGIGGDGQ